MSDRSAIGEGAARPGRRYRRSAAFLIGMLVVGIVVKAMAYWGLKFYAGPLSFVDFDAFHVAGRLALEGHAAWTYDAPRMFAAEAQVSPEAAIRPMPWAYPPQFDMVVAALAMLPRGLAYVLFTGGSLGAYLLVLARLSGPRFAEVVVAVVPAMVACVVVGQSGLLIGALAGWYALAVLRARPGAGLPLGLMVLKPHLAIGFGVASLMRGEGRVIAVAFATVAASAVLATLAFGAGIWPAFLSGVAQSGHLLREDAFPYVRMISIYAALRTVGLPVAASLIAQAIVACGALCVVVWAVWRRLGPRAELGLAAIATLAVSPYAYDYDLPVFGVGVALLWPLLAERLRPRAVRGLVLLCYVASTWSAVVIALSGRTAAGEPGALSDHAVAGAGFAYLAILGSAVWIIAGMARSGSLPVVPADGRPAG